MTIRPDVGRSSPAISRNVVVLPQPEAHEGQQFVFPDLQAKVIHGPNSAGKGLAQMRDYDRCHRRIVASPAVFFNPEHSDVGFFLILFRYPQRPSYNRHMSSSSTSTVRLGPLRLTPAVAGALYCLVSMLAYSATNACMNQLSLNKVCSDLGRLQ